MKVYLASPWFHGEEPDRLERVEKVLDSFKEKGLEVFSPRRENLVPPDAEGNTRTIAFNGNVQHVKDADFIVAIVDTSDKGTLFECGLAYAYNVPILYYSETLGEKPFNLMLAESCKMLGYVTNEEDLAKRVETLINKGFDSVAETVTEYKGEIE